MKWTELNMAVVYTHHDIALFVNCEYHGIINTIHIQTVFEAAWFTILKMK